MEIQEFCEFCGGEFTAQKTTTKCCSLQCSRLAYKQRIRSAKIEQANIATQQIRLRPIEAIKAKEFLTVRDTATILGYSRNTIYRLLKRGELDCINPGTRMIRIKRPSIDNLINTYSKDERQPKEYDISECYSINEAKKRFGVSERTLYDIVKRYNLLKIRQGKYIYVPKELLEKIFS